MDIKKISLIITFAPLLLVFFVIFITIMVVSNSTETVPDIPTNTEDGFSVPFKSDVNYSIKSNFGYRSDPINHLQDFHSGIDLGAPAGTEILASASGKVYRISLNKDSLGNFVMLEHEVNGVKYYTGYGHMSDGSIVVHEGQLVQAHQKLGIIGMTGRATGIHLHFSLHTPLPSFKQDYLKDPKYIIELDLKNKSNN